MCVFFVFLFFNSFYFLEFLPPKMYRDEKAMGSLPFCIYWLILTPFGGGDGQANHLYP